MRIQLVWNTIVAVLWVFQQAEAWRTATCRWSSRLRTSLSASEDSKRKQINVVVGGEDSNKLSYVRQLLRNCQTDSLDIRISLADQSQKQNAQDLFVDVDGPLLPAYPANGLRSLLLLGESAEIDGKRLQRMISTLTGRSYQSRLPISLEAGDYSHFLSLTYKDLKPHRAELNTLRRGLDAWELRVDLLEDQSPWNIHRQVAYLRSINKEPLPIVYTVRSVSQLGRHPDDQPERLLALVQEGLRAGVEWFDIECSLSPDVLAAIKAMLTEQESYRKQTRLIGSFHARDTVGSFADDQLQHIFRQCYHLSSLSPSAVSSMSCEKVADGDIKADILKVVLGASSAADGERFHRIGEEAVQTLHRFPPHATVRYIGLCLGTEGQASRVWNRYFTPVTHPLLAEAAPGQLSVEALQRQRQAQGLLSSKQFFLFGHQIQYSLSPAIHNTAFYTLQLPHRYSLWDAANVTDYASVLTTDGDANDTNALRATFGGASVTIPHKEAIIPFLDDTSEAARAIGAVNTIVPQPLSSADGQLTRYMGHNTDWLGMFRPLSQLMATTAATRPTRGLGVVLGAGGTARAACYTVKQLGLELVVINRNVTKAEELAERFGGVALSLEQLNADGATRLDRPVDVIISTLPVAAGPVQLPSSWLAATPDRKPIVLDVVYTPAWTPLLQQAHAAGCPIVQGATMLLNQAMEQFHLWHHRAAPVAEMYDAVFLPTAATDGRTNDPADRRVPKIDSLL